MHGISDTPSPKIGSLGLHTQGKTVPAIARGVCEKGPIPEGSAPIDFCSAISQIRSTQWWYHN